VVAAEGFERRSTMEEQGSRVFLDYEEAAAMLPDGDHVNVKLNPSGMLVGSDWRRESVLVLLANGSPELSGDVATSMGFGIAVLSDGKYYFVETKRADQ
jgi:hypothetical protein